MVAGISGQPEQVQIFNPFTVTPYNGSTQVFERAPYPDSQLITNPSLFGLALMKGYPEPNATPTDAFGELVAVRVPAPHEEAARDLVRAREDARVI